MGMTHLAQKAVTRLSSGEKQLAHVARAWPRPRRSCFWTNPAPTWI
nr:hypothetical protein [Desulfobacula sp.]